MRFCQRPVTGRSVLQCRHGIGYAKQVGFGELQDRALCVAPEPNDAGPTAYRCRCTGPTTTPIFAGEGDLDAAQELVVLDLLARF